MTPVVRAVRRVMPSVVNIAAEDLVEILDPYQSFWQHFFNPSSVRVRKYEPVGSGIIVDRRGLVVTNWHVVMRAAGVFVHLLGGDSHGARLVAFDAPNDICLLQLEGDLDPRSLRGIEMAVPGDLLRGETVITVGNPFGLEHSVAAGVLSAKNRSFREGDVVFNDILQTDAAINPGNSGGPLINLDGQLIGMNLAIRRGAEGIGFAIPMQRLEEVLSDWLLPHRFSDGWCGFEPATVIQNGRTLLVAESVAADGPAALAGLSQGDVIERLNGADVTRAVEAGRELWQLQPGDEVAITTADGRELHFAVESMPPDRLARYRLGIQVQELNGPLRRALGLQPELAGLAITDILPGSGLASFRARTGASAVRRGDIIHKIGGHEVATMDDLRIALQGTQSGGTVEVVIFAVDAVGNRVAISPFKVPVTLN